mmetsp:Transcript_110989/g.310123  ORF Transcript_110989/g.310123 Transcript_110989/m.310123 type:complete len:302 (-) Transcript_110989:17-922(-)
MWSSRLANDERVTAWPVQHSADKVRMRRQRADAHGDLPRGGNQPLRWHGAPCGPRALHGVLDDVAKVGDDVEDHDPDPGEGTSKLREVAPVPVGISERAVDDDAPPCPKSFVPHNLSDEARLLLGPVARGPGVGLDVMLPLGQLVTNLVGVDFHEPLQVPDAVLVHPPRDEALAGTHRPRSEDHPRLLLRARRRWEELVDDAVLNSDPLRAVALVVGVVQERADVPVGAEKALSCVDVLAGHASAVDTRTGGERRADVGDCPLVRATGTHGDCRATVQTPFVHTNGGHERSRGRPKWPQPP